MIEKKINYNITRKQKKALFAIFIFTILPTAILIDVRIMFFLVIISEIFSPILYLIFHIPIWLHSIIYYFPMYIVLVFCEKISFNYIYNFNAFLIIIISVLSIIVLLLWNIHDYMEGISGIYSKIPVAKNIFINKFFSYILAIVSEEIFFRKYLFFKMINIFGWKVIFISGILFFLTHYINRWSKKMFTIKKYISIFLLGIVLSGAYYYVKNIYFCIILHLIYNSSELIGLCKKGILKNKNMEVIFNDYD